jgi:ADP-heptose:LPS heptosyltransferase
LFLDQTRAARKVMVLDLGFLGDTIHLLPALWSIRQGYPRAELHVMVAEHVREILQVAPWVDRVWGYPRFPQSPSWHRLLGKIRELRRARFDVVINLNGSDRSSFLTFFSSAPRRLGRRPERGGPWFWDLLFTDIVEFPYKTMPISTQRWQCVKQAGFPGEEPEFKIEIPAETRRSIAEQLEFRNAFIHVSPFTTADYKELPLPQLTGLIRRLQQLRPDLPLVLSCAPNERETSKLARLLGGLERPPWKVFNGTLTLLELAALIQRSALHIGGDSGALHVAWMTGVPTVSWFRRYDGMADWMPRGARHGTVIGEASAEGLQGIETNALLESAGSVLSK